MINKTIFLTILHFFPWASTLTIKVSAPLLFLSISSCASTSPSTTLNESDTKTDIRKHIPVSTQNHGGYYLDDGPGDNPPKDLHLIPDAVPKLEPLREDNMRPYEALGQSFEPMTSLQPYKERGTATWYGRRYHGNHTASGEIYDMYAMTAAHPILPIPSYARVTNVNNGSSVIVRINDRGPFLSSRLIDLSYTAAYKLNIIKNGSGKVEVESILPDEVVPIQAVTPLASQQLPRTLSQQHNNSKAYLQLAAFGTEYSAHNYLSLVQKKFPQLSKTMRVRKKNNLFKIQVGPYSDEVLAQKAADTIAQRLSIDPLIIID